MRNIVLIISLVLIPMLCWGQDDSLEDLLEDIEEVVVVTAGRYEQTVTEAPALITTVTAQEIEEMGARTLMDILVTLPGFHSIQDNNEHVLSVRGVFASTNQKFLVLRDGHRLNEALFENVEPDYSISLANVKRIEIMRGPGASLYGNAALTAVINIITKEPKKAEGFQIASRVGNHGQVHLENVYGKSWADGGLLIYGQFTTVDGEEIDLSLEDDYNSEEPQAGSMYVDKSLKNFDLGLKLQDRDMVLSASFRHSHYAQPKGNGGQTIDWDNLWHELEQSTLYGNLDLKYERDIRGINFNARHFFDYSRIDTWQLPASPQDFPPEGRLFDIVASTTRLGIEYTAGYRYQNGHALAGFKVERWELMDSYFLQNWQDNETMVRQQEPLLPAGEEYNAAAFFQVHYAFLPQLKVNAGARYDYFENFDGAFNPRLALIVTPIPMVTMKAIYAKSFQAPSYFYRESNPGLGYGSTDDLEPEKMEVIQFATRIAPSPRWFGEISYFYNQLDGLITRDNTQIPSIYRNFGQLTVQGIEFESEYKFNRFSGFANYSYLVPVTSETEEPLMTEETVKNIPVHTANLGLTYRPLPILSTNVIFSWSGEIYSPIPGDPDHTLSSKTITHLTIVLNNKPPRSQFSVSVHNLFDVDYQQGGTVPPFPQQGRWITAKVGYKF